jgi:hypothetical protein
MYKKRKVAVTKHRKADLRRKKKVNAGLALKKSATPAKAAKASA